MLLENIFAIIASFTAPENIRIDPQSMLWLLPIAAAIAVIYKATKLPTITAGNFIKETLGLSGSIVVFITLAALSLCVLAWLVMD